MQFRWQQHTWWAAMTLHTVDLLSLKWRSAMKKQGLKTSNSSWEREALQCSDCTRSPVSQDHGINAVLCCGAVCEPAGWQQPIGWQLPTGSRTTPLGPWASKYTPGFAPQLLHPSCVFQMQYSTDSLLLCFYCLMIRSFQALGLSDSWGSAHITLSHNSLTKQMRRQFIFTIINFFFIVVKTLQESNTEWHTMLTATRQKTRSKKRDISNSLLHFSCGTYTSQQAFNNVPRSLKPEVFLLLQ